MHPNPSPKPILHDQELTQIDVFAQPLEFLVRTFLHPTPSAKPILHDQRFAQYVFAILMSFAAVAFAVAALALGVLSPFAIKFALHCTFFPSYL